jgi:prepilin signal peptidase PulO-like enzyme (type II secretory pathway)
MEIFFLVTAFIFGVMIGSFLNVLIIRLPNEDTIYGRSHCTVCKHQLSLWDLVPLFSYIFLLGKCRYCKRKISARYFTIEIITGILFAFSYWLVAPVTVIDLATLLFYWTSVSVLICVFVVDLEHFIILDNIIFPGALFLLLFNFIHDLVNSNLALNLNSLFLSSIIAGIIGALPFFLVWFVSKGYWMGFGDVKLTLFLGVCLGFPNIFIGLMVSVLLGGLVSCGLLAFTKSTLKTQLPFGTFLSVGTLITLFYGDKILKWYLSILGF